MPGTLAGLDQTVGILSEAGVPLRVNPGLAPLGFGLAESIGRHLAIRWQWPQVEMLMDVGSLTEMTEADSAGINVLLLGLCQELRIASIVTNQEASWARAGVRECDLARQMLHYAAKHHVLPRNLDPRLLLLRRPQGDPRAGSRKCSIWPIISRTRRTAFLPRMGGCT